MADDAPKHPLQDDGPRHPLERGVPKSGDLGGEAFQDKLVLDLPREAEDDDDDMQATPSGPSASSGGLDGRYRKEKSKPRLSAPAILEAPGERKALPPTAAPGAADESVQVDAAEGHERGLGERREEEQTPEPRRAREVFEVVFSSAEDGPRDRDQHDQGAQVDVDRPGARAVQRRFPLVKVLVALAVVLAYGCTIWYFMGEVNRAEGELKKVTLSNTKLNSDLSHAKEALGKRGQVQGERRESEPKHTPPLTRAEQDSLDKQKKQKAEQGAEQDSESHASERKDAQKESASLKAENAALRKREQELQQAWKLSNSELNMLSTARRSHLHRQIELCKRFKDVPQGHVWVAERSQKLSKYKGTVETREWQGTWGDFAHFKTLDASRAESLWARAEWTCSVKEVEAEGGKLIEEDAPQISEGPCSPHATHCDEWKPLWTVGPLTLPLRSLKAMAKWRDQGWGNNKGCIRAVLDRRGSIIAEKDLYGSAPRGKPQTHLAQIKNFNGQLPIAGDTIFFQYRIGGGGGHEIHIDRFNVEYWLDVQSTCHWWYWRNWRTWVPYSADQVEAIEEANKAKTPEVDLDDHSKLVFVWSVGKEAGRPHQVRKASKAGDAHPREARRLPVFWDTAQRSLESTFLSIDFDELCAADGTSDGDLRIEPHEYYFGDIDLETQCAEMHKAVNDKSKPYVCEKARKEDVCAKDGKGALPVLAPVQWPEEAPVEEKHAALDRTRAIEKQISETKEDASKQLQEQVEEQEKALEQLQVQVNTLSVARREHLHEQLQVCRKSIHRTAASSWVATREKKTDQSRQGVEQRKWGKKWLTQEAFKQEYPQGEVLWEAAKWTCNMAHSSEEIGTAFKDKAKPVVDAQQGGDALQQFFTIGPLKGNLKTLTVLCKWRDQGGGNNKGVIHVALSQHGAKAKGEDLFRPEGHHPDLGYAPRKEEKYKTHKAVLQAIDGQRPTKGDMISFQYRVGGGGGHHLWIDLFEVEYTLEEPNCHWWYWQSWRTWVPYLTQQVQTIDAALEAGKKEVDLDQDNKVVFAGQDGSGRPHQVPKGKGGNAQTHEVRRLPIYWDIDVAPAEKSFRSVGFDELCALDGGAEDSLRLTAREYREGKLDHEHECASMEQARKDMGRKGLHLCEMSEGGDLLLVPILGADGDEVRPKNPFGRAPKDELKRVREEFQVRKVCIVGSDKLPSGSLSELILQKFATGMAEKLTTAKRVDPSKKIAFVTAGMPGVMQTFAGSFASNKPDTASLTNLIETGKTQPENFPGTFMPAGASIDEKNAIFAELCDVYVSVRGGKGTAQQMQYALSRDAVVVPLVLTGGASGGEFWETTKEPRSGSRPNTGKAAWARARKKELVPRYASEEQWSLIANTDPAPKQDQVATALVEIVAKAAGVEVHSAVV